MTFADFQRIQTRRDFFRRCAGGLGTIALAHLLDAESLRRPHFPAKAKNVIFLFMEGGPSQLDLFDPKPALQKWHGTPLPASLTKDLRLAFIRPDAAVLASPRVFTPSGRCGTEFSDWLPHTASCADDICLVRSIRRTYCFSLPCRTSVRRDLNWFG